MKWNSVILAGVMALLGLGGSAEAVPVSGSIGWTGPGVLQFQNPGGIGPGFIDWCPLNTAPAPAGCNNLNNGTGAITVGSVTGDFVVDAGGTGTIRDQVSTGVNPPYLTTPAGVPNLNLAGYLDFSGEPWTYVLQQLDLQVCGPTEVCVGPFKISQTGPNTITVALSGLVDVIRLGETGNFIMSISSQFAGTSIPAFIAAASTSAGVLSSSWSGELRGAPSTVVPEPATMLTFGVGSALVAAMRRRRAAKKNA